MKQPIAIVILSGLLVLAPVLSAATAAPLRVDLADSGRFALIEIVQTPTAHGLTVTGVLAKRGIERGHILGDVDVELLNQDNKIIAMREGVLVGFGNSARNPDHGHFSVEFTSLPADAMAIRVRHHR